MLLMFVLVERVLNCMPVLKNYSLKKHFSCFENNELLKNILNLSCSTYIDSYIRDNIIICYLLHIIIKCTQNAFYWTIEISVLHVQGLLSVNCLV